MMFVASLLLHFLFTSGNISIFPFQLLIKKKKKKIGPIYLSMFSLHSIKVLWLVSNLLSGSLWYVCWDNSFVLGFFDVLTLSDCVCCYLGVQCRLEEVFNLGHYRWIRKRCYKYTFISISIIILLLCFLKNVLSNLVRLRMYDQ